MFAGARCSSSHNQDLITQSYSEIIGGLEAPAEG